MEKGILKIFLFLSFIGFALFVIKLLFDKPPVIKSLFVIKEDLAQDSGYSSEYGPVLPFGTILKGEGKETLSPTIEFYLKKEALVYSPIDGTITEIRYQPEDKDYYIWIKPRFWSDWLVEIDHLTALQVKKGEKVSAGQVLGKPGRWYPEYGVGRVELMIIKEGRLDHYFCPSLFLAKEVKRDYDEFFSYAFKDSTRKEELQKMNPLGCLFKELKDKTVIIKNHQNLIVVN
ncbi:MAG: hypothetical protein KatS3mg090_1004 [Patescibacteria group bacterium]|nr:MAG: hypothetical protein KatS3mg090_0120 [Patescibacteria group bacterium]GIW63178.1 MAG: hypothetical protein KatS3mg090_1004 [Patescibacteria group bacterium]